MARARETPLMRAPIRRWTHRVLALLGGVAVALIVGEGSLRLQRFLWSDGEAAELGWARMPSPVPYAGDCATQEEQSLLGDILWPTSDLDVVFRLIPNLDTCFKGARLRTNAEALRAERSYDRGRQAGADRILLLGDSQAFGWGVSYGQTVGAQLARELESRGRDRVEVINVAVPGYNTYQQAALLESVGSDYAPDCILVLFTSNDLALPFFLLRDVAVPARNRSLLLARIEQLTGSKRWFRFAAQEHLNYVVETDIERVPEGYRHMVGLDGYRAALRRMTTVAGGVPVVNSAELSELDPEVASEIVRMQDELGIVHLPLTWTRHRVYQLDPPLDPHPTPAAHRLLASALADALAEQKLCRAAESGGP